MAVCKLFMVAFADSRYFRGCTHGIAVSSRMLPQSRGISRCLPVQLQFRGFSRVQYTPPHRNSRSFQGYMHSTQLDQGSARLGLQRVSGWRLPLIDPAHFKFSLFLSVIAIMGSRKLPVIWNWWHVYITEGFKLSVNMSMGNVNVN